jgi:integrase
MKPAKANIEALDLPPGKTDHTEWFDNMPGAGVRVRSTKHGVRKVYRIQFRVGSQQRSKQFDTRKVSLGDFLEIARTAFAQAHLGRDVAAEKAQAALAEKWTLGATADRYLQVKQRTWRRSTFLSATRYLESHWAPFRKHALGAITRRDIAVRQEELIVQNGPSAAARASDWLSALYSWAVGQGLCDVNPVAGVTSPEVNAPRERVLTDRELAAVWNCAGDGDFGDIVKLLILVGARRSEIGELQFSEVDFDSGVLALPPERTKNGRTLQLPLPEMALAILRARPRRSEFVFGDRDKGFTNWSVATKKLRARIAETSVHAAPFRLHDLRRTMRTNLGMLGVRPDVAELCIGHVRKGMLAVYDRYNYQPEIGDALSLWADDVAAIVEGRERKLLKMKKRA